MRRSKGLLVLLLAAAFAVGYGAAEEAAEEAIPEPAVGEPAAGLDDSVLADPTRPEDEVAQDADRRALEVYEFFGVEPGMTVGDVWAAGGYNTHILSRLMGNDGKVFSILGFYAEGEYATADALTARVADSELSNVEIVSAITDVPADALDVAIAVRNYHDAEQLGSGRQATVEQLLAIMKPGGIVGIIELATPHEGWHEDTHRLNEATVVEEFTMGGFELVERSDMLANPDDDHSTRGFPARHTMDRYVLKFRKPVG